MFFSYPHKTTNQNLNMMAFSYMELWCFKVVKLDVCGSLVLPNLVTFVFDISAVDTAIKLSGD